MIKSILCVLLWSIASLVQAHDRWINIHGYSWHDRSGYNQNNWGLGLEKKTQDRWSAAVGIYRNSIDRTSVYGIARYHWVDTDMVKINVMIGTVSGYDVRPLAPVLLPELCVNWVCTFLVPKIGPNTTSALAIYLRVPF